MRLPFLGTGHDGGSQPCRCGHQARAHEHYRRGSDCALCECSRYKAGRGPFVVSGPRGERFREAA